MDPGLLSAKTTQVSSVLWWEQGVVPAEGPGQGQRQVGQVLSQMFAVCCPCWPQRIITHGTSLKCHSAYQK